MDNMVDASVPDSASATADDAQQHHHDHDHGHGHGHHHRHQEEHHHSHGHGHQETAPEEPYHAHPVTDDPIHPGELVAAITLETQEYPTISTVTAIGRPSRRPKTQWRKANAYWVLWIHTGVSLSLTMSMAPKIELFNQLACVIHYSQFPNDMSTLPVQSSAQAVHTSSVPLALRSVDPSLNNASVFVDFGETALSGAQQHRTSDAEKEQGGIDPIVCRKSPAVQAIAAKFNTVIGILLGVMSALTTGWWTRMSDKWGRKPVLSFSMTSLIIGDIIFLLTVKYPTAVPGEYRFLYAGAILSGLFGGSITLSAGKQAYIADCTTSNERSRFFAGLIGMGMVGLALGPLLGSFIVRWFSDVLSVFYLSLALRLVFLAITILLLPESLSVESMEAVKATEREQYLIDKQREAQEYRQAHEGNDSEGGSIRLCKEAVRRTRRVVKSTGNKMWAILSPLAIFWPKKDESNLKARRNWNLSLLAIGFCFATLTSGSGQPLLQYTQLVFGWGPAEIGLFMSTYGTAQAVYLLFFLPFIIRFFRYIGSSSTPSTPSDPSSDARSEHRLILFSTVVSILTYLGIIFLTTPTAFVAFLIMSCIGEGVIPLVSSLALLFVDDPTSTGKLLGAMSVLTAVLGTVLGPMLFGFTYATTTGIYPKAIFLLIIGLTVLTLAAFSMIRIRDKPRSTEDGRTTMNSSVHSNLSVDERSPLLTRGE